MGHGGQLTKSTNMWLRSRDMHRFQQAKLFVYKKECRSEKKTTDGRTK